MIQTLEGLDYLHHNGVVHGNLRATNILMTQTGEVKLSGFGISLYLHGIEHVDKGVSFMPNWAAPEDVELRPVSESKKSDIWSLECTITELLTGTPPYGDPDVLNGKGPFICPVSTYSNLISSDVPDY